MPVGADGRRGRRIALHPVAAGPAQHAAQKAGGRSRLQQERTIGAPDEVGDAVAHGLGLLRRLGGQVRRDPLPPRRAALHQRADPAGGRFRRADRGAEVHQRLRVAAGARSGVRRAAAPSAPAWRPAAACHGEEAGHDALDIAVEHGRGPVEGDGGDGGGGVGPDAGQGAQPVLRVGKPCRPARTPRRARISEGSAPARSIQAPPIRP
jgi:hypothetical protein